MSRALAATLIGALLMALPADAAGDAPRLSLPIACTLGQDCVIQQFFDHDPGPGARDYTCGPLSYDGHKGTDFRLIDLRQMQAGVTVLAAAGGTVRAVRNTMPDKAHGLAEADVAGRECGNGLVIDHGGGWETQYCHMRRGSVSVAKGTAVTRGQPLGLVGLSGRTEFPHVHLNVRRDGVRIDPFAPDWTAQTCDAATGGNTLWDVTPDYRAGGILAVGFATGVPGLAETRSGNAAMAQVAVEQPLVLWGYGFGKQEGDRIVFRIEGPQGEVFDHEETFGRTQAEYVQAGGRRAPRGGWPEGRYRGRIEVWRDATLLDAREVTLDARP